MNVLLVDDESDIQDILTFIVESKIKCEFFYAKSANQAIALIESGQKIDLIISDFNMPDGNGGHLYSYLTKNKCDIPFALCSSVYPGDHPEFNDRSYFIAHIVKPNLTEGVDETIAAFDRYKKSGAQGNVESTIATDAVYISISLELLEKLKTLPGDVFINLNSKLVRLMKKNDHFTREDLVKYQDKNIERLFVNRTEINLFVSSLVAELEELLKNSDPDKTEEVKMVTAHEFIMETLTSLGISEQIIQASEKSILYTLDIIKKNEDKVGYTDVLLATNAGTYLSKHSILLACITCGIVSKLPWDSFESRNKFVFASFYHDATIKIPNIDESNLTSLSDVNLKNFKQHPQEAMKLLTQFKGIPADIDKIILEHHEKPDGTGFPRGLVATQISQLGAVFILAHEVVDQIINLHKNGKELDRHMIMAELPADVFGKGTLKKPYEALQHLKIFKKD